MKPTVDAQEAVLRAREREDLIPLVPRYNTFVLLLGMVRPMQVDGVWDRDGLVYNAYLSTVAILGAILRSTQTLSPGCGGPY